MLLFSLSLCTVFAQQKKALTHQDYDLWKKIDNTKISHNGTLVVTTITTNTGRGDGYLKIYNVSTGNTFQFKNGYKTEISPDEKYVYFLRKPDYENRRKERKDEAKKDDRAKDDFSFMR